MRLTASSENVHDEEFHLVNHGIHQHCGTFDRQGTGVFCEDCCNRNFESHRNSELQVDHVLYKAHKPLQTKHFFQRLDLQLGKRPWILYSQSNLKVDQITIF